MNKEEYKKEYYSKNKEKIKAKTNRYYHENIAKVKAQRKEYRERNKDRLKAKKKEYYQESKEKLKPHWKEYRDKNMQEFISTYKTGKCCEICGYKEYPEILQFHHKGEKKKSFDISTFRRKKPELLKTEIDKCILLCPNCHFWLHFKEKNKNQIVKNN